jgi:hypothetical protein
VEVAVVSSQSGFSLVSALVSMSVISVLALSMMSLQSRHFKANAAVQWDLDVFTFRRSIVSQVDCEETLRRLPTRAVAGRAVPVDLFSAPSAARGNQPRRLLEGRPDGTLFGNAFRFRADLTTDGVRLMAKAEPRPGTKEALHPVLGANHKWRQWADSSPGDMPLCPPDLGSAAPLSAAAEQFTGELVLTTSSQLFAKDRSMEVSLLQSVDGGGDCQNTLVLECDLGSGGRRTFRLGEESARANFVLPRDKACNVRVESRLRAGSGTCQSGVVTGLRRGAAGGDRQMTSDNALTMQQGWSAYRIQWEDRLAYADDGKACARGKGDQNACARLRAMDWNDGIWLVQGKVVREAAAVR